MRTLAATAAILFAATMTAAGPKVTIHKVENTHCNANSGPSCTNSHSNIVVHYDLENDKSKKHYVSMFVSRDGGATYNEVEVQTVTGDVGTVDNGENKVIVWDPGADMPEGEYDNMRVKLMADEYVPNISMLYMTNMKVMTEKPSKVHFRFALRDQCNHAVIVPPSVLKENIKIFESNAEIDYSESAIFVRNACGNRMKVAIVLDFSQSMASIDAIPTVVDAAKRLINQLAVHHSMALVAYYDRNRTRLFGLAE